MGGYPMNVRLFAHVAFAAMLTSCTADTPGTLSGSALPEADARSDSPAASGRSSGDRQPNAQLLTPDGWGKLRIGMSRAEAVAAAGEDANPHAVGGADPAQCDEFRPTGAPAGLLVMIERGVLTRISVSRDTGIATPAGFRVGDAGSDVEAEYGERALIEPHQYWAAPARYITVWRETLPGAPRRGIRYEIDEAGTIVHLRAGGPSIEYVEGCT